MRIAAGLIFAGAVSLLCVGRGMVADAACQRRGCAPAAAPQAAPAPAPAPAAPPRNPQKPPAPIPTRSASAAPSRSTPRADPGFGFEHFKQLDFLRDKEVVLTFDDGPWPVNTPSVLKTLADECTTGIFFSIGKHATYYPEILKQVFAAGHTIGIAHLVACHADQQEADRGPAQGRDRERLQRGEMGAGRRFAGAVLPLPGAAASAGNGDLSRHPQHRDVLLRPRLLRFQGAQRRSR